MASFCSQCSLALLGADFGDLLGIGPALEPGQGYPALCEGCGPTLVDADGRCVDPCCDKHGIGGIGGIGGRLAPPAPLHRPLNDLEEDCDERDERDERDVP